MAQSDDLQKAMDELKPGDVDGHIDVARRLIAAQLYGEDVAEVMFMNLTVGNRPGKIGITKKEQDRYLAAVDAALGNEPP